ncbi:ras-related protein rab7 [Denticeps clupeoides]|uniref:ras-related protein rab7 n=1 Tax=Denticeps clupeoides TaxID=299321 RepID=UPI0010A436E4|nr:ras-related protein rab7-like [Denticeps clupeoides]
MEWKQPHLKVILIGNSGVGKSSFMNRFVNHRFTNLYRATIGTDFLSKEMTVDGCSVTLQIWDTAGTERFQSLGTALYRGAHCCLLLFDVTSAASFSALEGWLKEFLLQADPPDPASFPFLVVGNKVDLENREVTRKQAEQWCKVSGAEYFEGSAKEDLNVDKPFQHAAKAARQYYETHSVENKDQIHVGQEEPQVFPKDKCQC